MKLKLNLNNKAFIEYMKTYQSIDAEAELSKIIQQSNQIYKTTNRKIKIKRIYGLC